MTIEEQTAKTIIQKAEEIKVGDKTYTIAPPSIATLILVSAAVSRMPRLRLDSDKIIEETLSIAKDCEIIGQIAATLILGAKHVDEIVHSHITTQKRFLWGLIRMNKTTVKTETRLQQLSRELLNDVTPGELHNIVVQTLLKMQVGDFFGLTTFLTEINLMRPTKVVTEATASGQ